MKNSEILRRLDLGASVAENDENLAEYFVPTSALADFLADRYDLVRGVKGSGKSAMLRMVAQRQASYPDLGQTVLHVATEHTGEPSFKRAFDTLKRGEYTEKELVAAWKIYILNLAADALERQDQIGPVTEALAFLTKIGIRYKTDSLFKKAWWSLLRVIHMKSFSIGADSIKAEFPDAPPDVWTKKDDVIDFPEAHIRCVKAFEALGRRCWILVDRLDAAFQDNAELERLALRALLIAYKDFMGHKSLRLKLFFRTDLFDQVVTQTGFRELTHVLDRASQPIEWDADQLLMMIMERFAFNEPIRDKYGFTKADMRDMELRKTTFFSIFPGQIDVGKRKGDSWGWIYNHIRDGNAVRTPRDLQTLIVNAARKQEQQLALGGDEDAPELIGGSAVKEGLTQLSVDKVRTSLLAENAELESVIRAFQRGKAEHNAATLEKLLGKDWKEVTERLHKIGFLEKVGETWKVPPLYRDGLGITQGAAFEKPRKAEAEVEDDD